MNIREIKQLLIEAIRDADEETVMALYEYMLEEDII